MTVSHSAPPPATPIWLFWAASPRRAIVLSLVAALLVMGAALVLNGIAVPG